MLRLGVALGYFAAFAILFALALPDGGLLAPGDAFAYYLPNVLRLDGFPRPAWEPLLFSGFPVHGDPQTLAWHPLAWLLGRHAPPAGWNAFVVAGYAIAGAGAFALVRSLTGSRAAGAIAGLVYAGSGFLVGHLGHTSIVHSAAWIPLQIASLEALREQRSAGPIAALSLAVAASWLGGHPQLVVYGLALAGAHALHLCADGRGGARGFLARAALGVALGCGAAAVVWLPAAALAGDTTRASLTLDAFLEKSLRLDQLPRLLLPWAWGGFALRPGAGDALPYFGRSALSEATGFVGLVPLALAGIALGAWRADRRVRFWACAAALSLYVSLGRYGPGVSLLHELPVYGLFRVPARHLGLFSLALAVLAGLGAARLAALDPADRVRAARRASIGLVAAAAVAVVWVIVALASGYWDPYLERVGSSASAAMPWRNAGTLLQAPALALGLVALAAFARRPVAGRAVLLAAAIALDLACFAGFAEWRDAPRVAELAAPAELETWHESARESRQRVTYAGAAAPGNRSLVWAVPSTAGLGPLVVERYVAVLGLGPAGFTRWDAFRSEHRGLDLLASRYVIVSEDDLAGGPADLRRGLADAARFRQVGRGSGAVVFENLQALPRAWLAGEVLALDRIAIEQAVATSRLPGGRPFDPARTALVERAPPGIVRCGASCGRVLDVSVEAERLVVGVDAAADAFLVLSDVFDPGWQVTIDGAAIPSWRADGCLRALAVPAGRHEVELRYRPPIRPLAMALSGASGLAVAALGVTALRRRPCATPPPLRRSADTLPRAARRTRGSRHEPLRCR